MRLLSGCGSLLPLQEEAPDRVMVLWHAYTWLWFMLGVAAVYGFCREAKLSRPVSCGGMLLLYLCPRFFAEGHYNSKDMVLLTLFLCTLWLGLRFLKQPGFLRGALFSLAGAMAANTKVVGFFVWGLMGLCAVVLVTAQRRWDRPDGVHSGRNRRAFCGVLCPADPRAVERSGGVSALSAGQRVRLHALAGGGVVSRHAL